LFISIKGQFGDRFLWRMSDVKDGKRVNFYHLVKEPEVYQPYMESFSRDDGPFNTLKASA
jgi:hypothetical protein